MTLAKRLREAGLQRHAHRGRAIHGRAGERGAPRRVHLGPLLPRRSCSPTCTCTSLLEDLELGDRLRWGTTRTGFYTDGRLYSLSTSLDFALFPPLSLIDKARLAGHHPLRLAGHRLARTRSRCRWPTGWSDCPGKRVFQRMWLPLLRSKLGENYRLASASFIWAIIQRMYAARRSGLKQEMFGYVDGGYALVLDRFQQHLDSLGVETLTGHPVSR